MNTEKLRAFATDLNRVAPRSPSAALEDFPVWAARLVDKCRAELLGRAGSYRFNCPMDRRFLEAAGLSPEPLRNFVATSVGDNQVEVWMAAQAKVPKEDFLRWSRRFRANPPWRLLKVEDGRTGRSARNQG